MPVALTVLIAAPDLLPTLKQRTTDASEILTFSDADALRALEVITKRKPGVVAIERLFAATPRGAALINRIKADPALHQAEIRVVSHEADYTRVSARAATEAPPAPAAIATAPLDQRGTRRAPRFRVATGVDAVIDGNVASIVDLSTIGVQVVSPTILKPNQRVRMALNDEGGSVKIGAVVAWASFEIPPKSGPRYRAGIEFLDADGGAVDAFCGRHRA